MLVNGSKNVDGRAFDKPENRSTNFTDSVDETEIQEEKHHEHFSERGHVNPIPHREWS